MLCDIVDLALRRIIQLSQLYSCPSSGNSTFAVPLKLGKQRHNFNFKQLEEEGVEVESGCSCYALKLAAVNRCSKTWLERALSSVSVWYFTQIHTGMSNLLMSQEIVSSHYFSFQYEANSS